MGGKDVPSGSIPFASSRGWAEKPFFECGSVLNVSFKEKRKEELAAACRKRMAIFSTSIPIPAKNATTCMLRHSVACMLCSWPCGKRTAI
eukprot:1161913-Pelagomonas_calceolata.AAC.3